jgi:hypothetical protein
MILFARRIEHAFDVTVQCPHDADARHHRREQRSGAAASFDEARADFERAWPVALGTLIFEVPVAVAVRAILARAVAS